MSIDRDVFWRSIASRSASSTITNCPLATSHPRTISSLSTSRSCTGHQRRFLIGVLHSAWSWRKDTSEARADGFVAGASPTGVVTRLKLIEPFQVVRMGSSNSRCGPGSLPLSTLRAVAGKRTIGALWRNAAARGASPPPYLAERDGAWVEVSWVEAARRVDALANGLLDLGVKKGDAFSILASTTLEWCLFDFALGLIGAIGAPVYANSSAPDAAYVIGHSEAVGVLVEDEEQLAKIDSVRDDLGGLRHVLTFAGLPELEERGREHACAHPQALTEAEAAVDEDDLFTYIYT